MNNNPYTPTSNIEDTELSVFIIFYSITVVFAILFIITIITLINLNYIPEPKRHPYFKDKALFEILIENII